MLKYIARNKIYFVIIGIIIIAEPIVASVLNLYFEKLLNFVVPGADIIIIVRMMLIAFLYWITRRILNFVSSVINIKCMNNIRKDIKEDTFKNLLKMNLAELEGISNSGEYTSIFINDINILEQRYFQNIVNFVASFVAVLINSAALIYMNYKLSIPILIFTIFVALVPIFFIKKLSQSQFDFSIKIANFTQSIKEFVGAYPTIKNYEVEDPVFLHFRQLNGQTEDTKFLSEYDLALASSVSSLLSWFMQIIACGVGFVLVIKGEILLGTVIVARTFANDIAEPLNNMVTSLNSILSIEKITEKIKYMTEKEDSFDDDKNLIQNGNINFSNVCLDLNGKKILNNFSYEFEYGKKYLLIGKNGSGKTTICRLLKKRYQNYTGDISVGNVNINNISTKKLSKIVSYLNEKVDLFSGTVRDNITLFSNNYTEEQIKDAVDKIQLSVDLNRKVNDSGFTISSGEKRRIEIARSILQGSSMIIFDEVVSTLDVLTAYEIEKIILDYNKTIIFISHNFSAELIKKYDEILIVDDGNLIDSGSYDELIEKNDYFKKICELKFGSKVLNG